MAENATLRLTLEYNDTDGQNKSPDELTFAISTANKFNLATQRLPIESASFTTIHTFGSKVGGGQNTPKLLIVRNDDENNAITLKVFDTSGHTAYIEVAAKGIHIITSDQMEVDESETAFSAFSTIDTIAAKNSSAENYVTVYSIGED